jgi:hypothetical protein
MVHDVNGVSEVLVIPMNDRSFFEPHVSQFAESVGLVLYGNSEQFSV